MYACSLAVGLNSTSKYESSIIVAFANKKGIVTVSLGTTSKA